MEKKSEQVFLKVIQICTIFLWVGLLLIFNSFYEAQPKEKQFFEYFFKINTRSYWDLKMLNRAVLGAFIQLFFSFILLYFNANFHKKKMASISFSIIFSIISCFSIILYYILVF